MSEVIALDLIEGKKLRGCKMRRKYWRGPRDALKLSGNIIVSRGSRSWKLNSEMNAMRLRRRWKRQAQFDGRIIFSFPLLATYHNGSGNLRVCRRNEMHWICISDAKRAELWLMECSIINRRKYTSSILMSASQWLQKTFAFLQSREYPKSTISRGW